MLIQVFVCSVSAVGCLAAGLSAVCGKNYAAAAQKDKTRLCMCFCIQVIVLQEYRNNSSAAIEAKYVFPLDEMSVVCGFEAFINGKHVVGVVKEKETAHREYRQAVEAGHGAYLMDQEKEQPV